MGATTDVTSATWPAELTAVHAHAVKKTTGPEPQHQYASVQNFLICQNFLHTVAHNKFCIPPLCDMVVEARCSGGQGYFREAPVSCLPLHHMHVETCF